MSSPLDQLDQARKETLAASETDFLRRLGEYVELLHTEETIKGAVEELRQEVVDADALLTRSDAEFVAKLVPIRQRLTEEEPEVDDSDEPWPGPYEGLNPASASAFHKWTYTLANFDAIAEDREQTVRVDGGGDQLNTSRTQMLVAILNAKLHDLVLPFNERPAPRPDLRDLYDEMSEVGHEQTNAYRRVERIADENGWFALNWVEKVAEAMEPRESRPLKTPDDKRQVLEEALRKPDLFRLYEVLRPTEARGSLSDAEKETVARLERTSRAELDHLHRPLRRRIEQREATGAPSEKKGRRPTLFGRIAWLPPVLSILADIGGAITLILLILAGLKLVGIF